MRLAILHVVVQVAHLAWLGGNLQESVLEVTINTVFRNAFTNDVITAPAQIVEYFGDTVAVFLTQLFQTTHAVDDLPAVATGGAPANSIGLNKGDRVTALGERQGSRCTGKPGADNTDVRGFRAQKTRIIRVIINRRRVVRRRVFLSLISRFDVKVLDN